MDPIQKSLEGGMAEGITTYLNGIEEDRREKMKTDAAMHMKVAQDQIMAQKQEEHDKRMMDYQNIKMQEMEDYRDKIQKQNIGEREKAIIDREDRFADTEAEREFNNDLSATPKLDIAGKVIGYFTPNELPPGAKDALNDIYRIKSAIDNEKNGKGTINRVNNLIASRWNLSNPDSIKGLRTTIEKLKPNDIGEFIRSKKNSLLSEMVSTYQAQEGDKKAAIENKYLNQWGVQLNGRQNTNIRFSW